MDHSVLTPDNQKLLNDSLGSILEWAKAAGDFVQGQAPLIAQEIITFGRVAAWVQVGFGLLLLVFTGLLVFMLQRHIRKHEDMLDCEPLFVIPGGLVALIGGIGGMALVFDNALIAMKATFAPRLYLIEYVSALIR